MKALLLFLLCLADAVLTYISIKLGFATEANPLMNYLLKIHTYAFLYKVIFAAGFCSFLYYAREEIVCKIGINFCLLVYGSLFLYHSIGLAYGLSLMLN